MVGAYYLRERIGEQLVIAAWRDFDDSLFGTHDAANLAVTPVLNALQTAEFLPRATVDQIVSNEEVSRPATLVATRLREADW